MIRLLQLLLLLLFAVPLLSVRAQVYRVDTLARGPQIQLPSSLAFIPGKTGAFFFAERSSGQVRLFDGTLRSSPFLTVPVEDEGEEGLLGVAVHPSYPDSPFVYIYYVRAPDRASVLERYLDQDGFGSMGQTLLFIPRRDEATYNNGGTLRFGPDGKLYVAVGDHGVKPMNAQDTLGGRNLRGKVLRLNSDGTIPSDNPFPGRYFWAIGLRAPGGLGFDPANGILYMTESGVTNANEIRAVTRGENLGWPLRHPPPSSAEGQPPPLYTTGARDQPVLTGIAMYRADAFPRLRGRLLFTGNADPTLWIGTLGGRRDTLTVEPFYRSNTGFADVQIGPDGCIYLVNGPYLASRILRLSPIIAQFTQEAPVEATQGAEYDYTPTFLGTPPELELLAGPEGMKVDTVHWSLQWTPTNAQALAGLHPVILRAHNGAGWTDQRFVVRVQNVNDPPSSFALSAPTEGSEQRFLGEDPAVMFSWTAAHDPDLDTVRYVLRLDTVSTLDSPFLLTLPAGTEDSLLVHLPSVSHTYFWRVDATDGRLATPSVPPVARVNVVFSKFLKRERAKHVESVLEQNFPNPFNPATSIKYTLPRGGYVRLTVYNLLGQEVARLYDGFQQEGTYEVAFAQANLPSGIYFYRLIAPGFAETKKMVIAR